MKVLQLWRYPIKSVGGERLSTASIGDLGIELDRGWGIRDNTTGNVLTGRREPRLLMATARIEDGRPVITTTDDSRLDTTASIANWLGRDVSLVRAGEEGGTYEVPLETEKESEWFSWQGPRGAWHDSDIARVSLLGDGTIGDWDVRRFRPNVLLATSSEDSLCGHAVRLGRQVVLSVTRQLSRCVMVNREQPGIPADPSVLRIIKAEREMCMAIGSLVAVGGEVSEGDELVDLGEAAEAG